MMLKQHREPLGAAIDAERAALDRVITTLRAETSELAAAKSERLESLVQSKARELAELAAARTARLAALTRAGIAHQAYAAGIALATDRALAEKWSALQAAAHAAMLQNTLNAKLAAMRLKLVSGRLDVLRGAAGRTPVYSADGRTQSAPGRTIATA